MAITPQPTSQQIINDVEPRSQYVATAAQTVFNTNWTANASSDVVVYSRTSEQEADDQTQQVSTADYNVEFVGTYQTVRVTFLIPRAENDIVTIVRDTPADRVNLYTNTNFVPSMLNNDFGILTLVDQQNQMYDQDFCPHYNLSASYTDDNDLAIDLILPILGASQFWVKNNTNTKFIAATLPSGGTNLPNSSPFVTYKADSDLTDAQNLGLLSNGVLGITVADSVATIYSRQPTTVIGQRFLTSGADTYVPTSGTCLIWVRVIGGGGGGGGAIADTGQVGAGGGGGAGGYLETWINNPSNTAYSVGAAGAGGVAGSDGSNGGITSFGSYSANGGQGGSHVNSNAVEAVAGGGAGGSGTGGLLINGQTGMNSFATATLAGNGGQGGSGPLGYGGAPGAGTSGSKPGFNATGYGAGGGGAMTNGTTTSAAGGSGSGGLIVIIEFG